MSNSMHEPPIPRIPFSLESYRKAEKSMPGVDALALYHNNILARFVREYLNAMERELNSHDLGMGRHVTLNIISMHEDEGISPAELASMIGVTRGAMTGLIDGLESEGMVVRRKNPDDRRAVKLLVTKKGRDKQKEYYPQHARRLSNFMNTLSKKEQKQLITLIDKLAVGFRELTETP